jgi:hypothetical protein
VAAFIIGPTGARSTDEMIPLSASTDQLLNCHRAANVNRHVMPLKLSQCQNKSCTRHPHGFARSNPQFKIVLALARGEKDEDCACFSCTRIKRCTVASDLRDMTPSPAKDGMTTYKGVLHGTTLLSSASRHAVRHCPTLKFVAR